MRILSLIDGDNVRNGVVNTAKKRSQFRFVDYHKINNFVIEYLSNNLQYKGRTLTHIKTYFYSGEYTDNLIKRIESSIKRENNPAKHQLLCETLDKSKRSKELQSEFMKIAKNYYFFEVRTKPLQFSPSKLSIFRKGVDVQIAVDLVEFSYKNVFDIVVLMSGDIDLLESIKTAKNLGKHVIIWGDDSVTAEEMKREADLFVDIGRFTDEQLNKISPIAQKGVMNEPNNN